MPHFTLQISPGGPILTAIVTVSQPKAAALHAAQQPIPGPVTIRALVDTGASCTCVDPAVLTSLQLTPTGSTTMHTPSTGAAPATADQYDVGLAIYAAANQAPLFLTTVPVIGAALVHAHGIHALIGRDILSQCVLHYNGATGTFTLAF